MRSTSTLFAAVLLAPLALPLMLPSVALAATPGAVQAEQSPTMPGPADGGGLMKGPGAGKNGGKLAGFFTPEQRAMFMAEAREQIKDMSPDQKKAFRKDRIAKIMAMSDGDRQKLKTDLQAKWDALPQGRKDRMEQRLASQGPAPAAQ